MSGTEVTGDDSNSGQCPAQPNGNGPKTIDNDLLDPKYRDPLLKLMRTATQEVQRHNVKIEREVIPKVYEEVFQVWLFAKPRVERWCEIVVDNWDASWVAETLVRILEEEWLCSEVYGILAESSFSVELDQARLNHQDMQFPALLKALLKLPLQQAYECYKNAYGSHARHKFWLAVEYESVELPQEISRNKWLTAVTIAIGTRAHVRGVRSWTKPFEIPDYLLGDLTTSSSYTLTTIRSGPQLKLPEKAAGTKGNRERSKRPRAPFEPSVGDAEVEEIDPKRRSPRFGKKAASDFFTIPTNILKPNLQPYPTPHHSVRNPTNRSKSNRRKRRKFRRVRRLPKVLWRTAFMFLRSLLSLKSRPRSRNRRMFPMPKRMVHRINPVTKHQRSR